jgi:peptidyl-prolyl cis-trans isomerase B (cyclophilin B)
MRKFLLPYYLVFFAYCLPIAIGTAHCFSQDSSRIVLIETNYGKIKIKLYNETPLHRDNFLKLVQNHFYDSLLFHRVINTFMIQGGDPDSKNAPAGKMLGEGEVGYTIPAEFNQKLFHKRGVLAAARNGDEVNPEQASSGCQF